MNHQYSIDSGQTWIDAPPGLQLRFRDVPSSTGETFFALVKAKPSGFDVELIDQDTGEAFKAELTLDALTSTILNPAPSPT